MLVALGLTACPSEEAAELPPEEPLALLDDDDDFPIDDDDAADVNDTPDNLLTVQESGTWSRTPAGGPYGALVGDLHHIELWDGVAPPDPDDPEDPGGPAGLQGPNCRLSYAVTATPAPDDPNCPGCVVWTYQSRLSAGEPAWCLAPDLPADETEGRFGWSSADGGIYVDFEGLGIWLFQYVATEDVDDLLIEWHDVFGFNPPDPDD